MVIVKFNPTSPGKRHANKLINPLLYKGKPFDKLTKKINNSGGRNNNGRITVRHIGGGHKKKYRVIDFKRNKDNIIAKVKRIEYDPNRSANIALILYNDGEYRYILCPKNIKVGDLVESGNHVPIKIGNTLPMRNIPTGSIIHNIEIKLKKGGQIARSAGSYAQIMSFNKKNVILRLKSGQLRIINYNCRATLGVVSNEEHMLKSLGKAGANRWRNIRPTVRGTAMNPIDHPHGGGEGRNFGKHPVSPWGKSTKGKKTRNNKRTNKFIINNYCNN
ncbi:MAG: 50S ribosomal protein L2 [Candidatus Lightella neohaematopini]|nr:50S ribosomal protein L2 [Candidatus Lightella neohaematopini]MCV2524634.1 50S ribosomal protein L2 [Candidatus Lightella neohaematopini]